MNKKTIPIIIFAALVSIFIFWTPFLLRLESFWGINFGGSGMNVIVQNFDGLNFLVVAKSLYNPVLIEEINAQFLTGNEPIYFSAHYPLMALIIRALSSVVSLPNALLITIITTNLLLAYALVHFFAYFVKNKKLVMILSLLALFFPARMLSVRAVGSNEPLFMAFVLLSLVAFSKKQNWQSALLGSLAVLTRSPGILLFGAYVISTWYMVHGTWLAKIRSLLPYLLMPITLLALFGYYGYTYGDYFAYFNSGDNLHLFFPPFTIFSNTATWISDMWREDIVYLYLFYIGGLLLLPRTASQLKAYALVYGSTLLFVSHRDLARYSLPLSPLVWLGYENLIARVPASYAKYLWIALIPIYLFGWQFVLSNIQPINDWSVFL
jgi:Gpi18-like mannosyltransferase